MTAGRSQPPWRVETGNPSRLLRLARAGLLGAEGDPEFDNVARLAQRLLVADGAYVSLLDERYQFIKSAVGRAAPTTGSLHASASTVCVRVLRAGAPIGVECLVDGSAAGAGYLGVPVRVDAKVVGTLCVLGAGPRRWRDDDIEALTGLARLVEKLIALALLERDRAQEALTYRAIARNIPDGGILLFDDRLRFVFAEGARLFSIAGFVGVETVEGKTVTEVIAAPNTAAVEALCREALEGRTNTLEAKRGERWFRLVVAPLLGDAHEPIRGGILFAQDVTEVRRRELLLRTLVRSLPNTAVSVLDDEGRFVFADGPKLEAATGLRGDEFEGRRIEEMELGAEVETALRAVDVQGLSGEEMVFEPHLRGRIYEARATDLKDSDGAVVGRIAVLYDITARREDQNRLERARRLLDTTLAHVEDGVCLLDTEGHIQVANWAFAMMFRLDPESLQGMHFSVFVEKLAGLTGERPERLGLDVEGVEVLLPNPRRVLRRTVVPFELMDAEGQVMVWRDVTAEKNLAVERERQAMTDALTALPNRRAMAAWVARDAGRHLRQALSVAVVDIDHFKQVNDVHGHNVGDTVLRQVADILRASVRSDDLVARWGGEEFVLALPVGLSVALAVCERMRASVEALEPSTVGRVTISIGLVQRRGDESFEAVIERADQRLLEAKRSGRNRVVIETDEGA